MLRNLFATAMCLVFVTSTSVSLGQNASGQGSSDGVGRAQVQLNNGHLAQTSEALPKELEDLLVAWARDSASVLRLEGEHLRRVYDTVFEVEKISEGKFFFEFPDKGRIDVTPTEVTDAMRQLRAKDLKKVQLKKNGQPFDLESDKEEKWICDGRQVLSIDETVKVAQVLQLPPDLQGTNIMDSPLPFLFGMPPDKAKRRFALSFSRPFVPSSGFAQITALPRTPQDAQSWSKAEVILDLKTFLPTAVKLTDPPGTKITVFSFKNMKKNERDWFFPIPGIAKGRLFEPDLRGYQIVRVGDGEGRKVAAKPPKDGMPQTDQPIMTVDRSVGPKSVPGDTLPDFTGVPWPEAVKMLEAMGLKQKAVKGRISLVKGSPAGRPDDVNRVQRQMPAPGTRVGPDTNVQLWIWLEPATAQK